jgi:hypothetical protein
MIKKILEARIIRPTNNLFTSPVVVVNKKDKSLGLCVDYKALNRLTVTDKFLIPLVDELFEELTGATVFSKMDLRY